MLDKLINKFWTAVYNDAAKKCNIGKISKLHERKFKIVQQAYKDLCVTNDRMTDELAQLRSQVHNLKKIDKQLGGQPDNIVDIDFARKEA